MPVAAMNHFTVLSDDLEATRRFYCDLFGFKVGWRPPFQFPGWWLYADDDTPILHVIHSKDLPQDRGGVLDHMAFSAKDLPATVATLKREGIDYELRRLPGGGIWQLFSTTRAAPRSSSISRKTNPRPKTTSRPDPHEPSPTSPCGG
jgi:catechol 2,3-dioxygenase-like lactoylglutathione lyase family enzyme